jgi:hypothetical protein
VPRCRGHPNGACPRQPLLPVGGSQEGRGALARCPTPTRASPGTPWASSASFSWVRARGFVGSWVTRLRVSWACVWVHALEAAPPPPEHARYPLDYQCLVFVSVGSSRVLFVRVIMAVDLGCHIDARAPPRACPLPRPSPSPCPRVLTQCVRPDADPQVARLRGGWACVYAQCDLGFFRPFAMCRS